MNADSSTLSTRARSAAKSANWPLVESCARKILQLQPDSAEGLFLAGLAAKATHRLADATKAFESALTCDATRYDAAVELAGVYLNTQRHAQSYRLLESWRERLRNSPRYLDMAGTIYSNLGLPERAWPMFVQACELQPDISLFKANLAGCGVQMGKIGQARTLYRELLERYPASQRFHFQLSGLQKAGDDSHIRQMKTVLDAGQQPPEKNIFLYYAIAKELEDIRQWDEAFFYYKMAGDAVARVAHYDVATDEMLIDGIIETCTADWLTIDPNNTPTDVTDKTPIFIVGLPRTGTTLTERILSSHSQVGSIGESYFLQMAIQRESGFAGPDKINPAIIAAAAKADIARIANDYLNEVGYRFDDKPFFIEKLPDNILYTGFIAKAFPNALLVHVQRHPMDACFAMYKQSYFRFAYTLDHLARYYIAYDRLIRHWRAILGPRLTELRYEELVTDQENQTRLLLDSLGLPFEQACLEFERNPAASATASSVQVREKIHTGSIGKWRHFEQQLLPLRQQLEAAGIKIA